MKPEHQRIAIAKACGVKIERYDAANYFVTDKPDMRVLLDELPDYLNDLNAMHEAEKVLIRIYEPPSAHKEYDTKLWAKMRDDGLELNGFTWHATAAQRAEAFLKTIGKWEGGEP